MNININKYFPFDEYRKHQRESIVDILKEFIDNYISHYILESGTGSGKSGIAYTVGKSLLEKKSHNGNGPPIIICTSTRVLQDQYSKSFKDIFALWSASHYKCKLLPDVEEIYFGSRYCLGENCTELEDCEYKLARRDFMNAKIGVLNYNYFLVDRNINNPILLVMDEAHNLEDILCEYQSVSLSINNINKIVEICKSQEINDSILKDLVSNANDLIKIKIVNEDTYKISNKLLLNLDSIQSKLEKNFKKLKKNLFSDFDDLELIDVISEVKPQLKGIEYGIDNCSRLIDKLNNFSIKDINWIISEKNEEKIQFKPLEINKIFQSKITADHILYMSATICGPQQFSKDLGIKEFKSRTIPNIFSPKNRPIHIFNCGALNAKNKSKLLPEFIKTIDKIIDKLSKTVEKNIRGIIHSVSYENAEIIKKLSKHKKRLIIPTKNEIMNISELLNKKPDTIILSPAIHEGIDLKDDLSRFQIFPKIPFGYLGDKWIKAKMDYDSIWYTRKTIVKLIQGSGRSIRSEDDWAITFILDSNFYRLLQNKELFPQWYLEALKFHK